MYNLHTLHVNQMSCFFLFFDLVIIFVVVCCVKLKFVMGSCLVHCRINMSQRPSKPSKRACRKRPNDLKKTHQRAHIQSTSCNNPWLDGTCNKISHCKLFHYLWSTLGTGCQGQKVHHSAGVFGAFRGDSWQTKHSVHYTVY